MDAKRRERGRRRWRAFGSGYDIGADADHDAQATAGYGLGLQQDSGELFSSRQHIVGPFQRKLHIVQSRRPQRRSDAYFLQRRLERKPRGKTQRRRDRGQNVDHFEDAAGEIATWRYPRAMPPSTSRRLLRCHKPHRSTLAIARPRHRFGVGRADLIEGSEPVTRGYGSRTERKCHLKTLGMIFSENRGPPFGIMPKTAISPLPLPC